MKETIGEWTQEEVEIADLKRHNMPHTERCCGEVAKIPHWVAYRLWLENKLKKVERYKNKNIF